MNIKSIFVILLQIGLICTVSPVVAWAQEQAVLLSVGKHDEVNVSRLSLQFDRLPEFQLKTSGQRVEVILSETQVSPQLGLPPEDERLVRVLVGQGQNKTMLSFLLRRPPYFVNSVKNKRDHRLVIDLHWQDSQRGTRPAISRHVPGQTSIQGDGGTAGRGIYSKYSGDWRRFFAEYERPVTLQAPVRYTLAPFPCLDLVEEVADVLPLDVLALASLGDWDGAISALTSVGLEAERGDAALRLMLVKADLYHRAGDYKRARRFLQGITSLIDEEQQQDLAACVSLQRLYLAKDQANSPFELLAELTLATDQRYPVAMQKYIDLFQAEVLIAAGVAEPTQLILEGALFEGVGELENVFRQRLADVAFLQNNYRGAIDHYSAVMAQLEGCPFSLAGYATSLYRDKQYDAMIDVAKRLIEILEVPEQRDLTRYLMGLALIHRGDAGAGYDLFHKIIPGTTGSTLAQAKIADLGMQSDDFFSRRRSLNDFQSLIDKMPTRSGRAEMQFKHAVAMYLMGHRIAAIEELQHFLKSDRLTDLVPHAQALLVEILPDVIYGLVDQGMYFEALVLVEQNRDLLVASQKNFSFLVELGNVFSELEFSERAVRLYLYLLDVTVVGERQEQIYRPLMKALMQQQEYQRVIEYAEQYYERYSDEPVLAEVFFIKVQALQKLGRESEVQQLLAAGKRPQSAEIDRLAAQLAWESQSLQVAAENIARVVGEDLSQARGTDVLLQAEVMMSQGKLDSALSRFQHLKTIAEFADHAQYREATIYLKQGAQQRGLNLLEKLVDNSNGGPWRDLAQETLEIERFNR